MNRRTMGFLLVAVSLFSTPATYAVVGCGNTPSTGTSQVQVSPTSLFFSLSPGGVASQAIAISEIRYVNNIGSADGWTHSKNVTWLNVTPATGSCPGGGSCTTAAVTVSANLPPGTYSGRVDITAFHCNSTQTGSTVSVSVRLQISSAVIALSANSVTFSGQVGGPPPAPQDVTITNAGTGTMNWIAQVVSGGNWLQVSPTTGTDAGTIRVSANTSGLPSNNYFGTIEVSSAAAANSPQRISASMELTSGGRATIALNPASLQFSATVGTNPTPRTFQIGNTGTGALGWTATPSVSWLSVSPTTGVAPSTVTVTVNSTTMPAGTHRGNVTIQALASANATNSPQVIPVTLSIGAACSLPEPKLEMSLAPGYYIAEVRTAPGTGEGYWGMTFEAERGPAAGGFNLGGGVQENGATPAFGAFSLPDRQTVKISLEADVVPGEDASRLSVAVRLLNRAREPVVTDQFGRQFVQFERELEAGFYVVEVRTGAGAPRARFLLGLSAPAFDAGVHVGGFLAPGMVGFGAFYLLESQGVTVTILGQPSYGSAGASCLQLTLLDADGKVIRTVP